MVSPLNSKNRIDLKRLQAALPDLAFHLREETESTNDWALQSIENMRSGDSTIPAVFIARLQTAGRGRGVNQWQAAVGSLTLTIVIPALFSLADRRRRLISLAVGCGLCDAVDWCGENSLDRESEFEGASLKWPNDIYLNDRKLGGVLVETGAAGDWLVVGCGLNINNETGNVSGAISLREQIGRSIHLTDVAIKVIAGVLGRIRALDDETGAQFGDVQKRDWLMNRPVQWLQGERSIKAICHGIAEDGGLVLEIDGERQKVYSGSIRPLSKRELDESHDFEI